MTSVASSTSSKRHSPRSPSRSSYDKEENWVTESGESGYPDTEDESADEEESESGEESGRESGYVPPPVPKVNSSSNFYYKKSLSSEELIQIQAGKMLPVNA